MTHSVGRCTLIYKIYNSPAAIEPPVVAATLPVDNAAVVVVVVVVVVLVAAVLTVAAIPPPPAAPSDIITAPPTAAAVPIAPPTLVEFLSLTDAKKYGDSITLSEFPSSLLFFASKAADLEYFNNDSGGCMNVNAFDIV